MSGIYIPGLRVPEENEDELWIVVRSDGTVFFNAEYGCTMNNGKAVSVPSHGRLIDADILRSQCDDPYWCVWLSEIDDSPTIIPGDKEESTNE